MGSVCTVLRTAVRASADELLRLVLADVQRLAGAVTADQRHDQLCGGLRAGQFAPLVQAVELVVERVAHLLPREAAHVVLNRRVDDAGTDAGDADARALEF